MDAHGHCPSNHKESAGHLWRPLMLFFENRTSILPVSCSPTSLYYVIWKTISVIREDISEHQYFTLEILSPSTRSIDMVYKLNTFMTSGVSEFWIVDLDSRRITLYTFVDYKVYKSEVYKASEVAKSEIFEGLMFDLNILFEDELLH